MSVIVKLLQSLLLFLFLSITIFFLKDLLPTDPVEQALGIYSENEFDERTYTDEEYIIEARKLGLDKPKFYFSITPSAWDDNFQKLIIPEQKKIALKLINLGLNWKDIEIYLEGNQRPELQFNFIEANRSLIRDGKISNEISFGPEYNELLQKIRAPKKRSIYYPKFKWQGKNNQYHNWIISTINIKNSFSNIDKQPAGPKISSALKWTLSITLPSLLISFGLGIFLGIKNVNGASKVWSYFQSLLDLLYSMPLFWFATLMVIFFTTSDYGKLTNVFPSIHSMKMTTELSVINNLKHLILPILCFVLLNTGYISALMTRSLKDQLSKPFILTAQLKGLNRAEIIKQHGLKNALFPIVTLFTSAIPASFAGSLILEIIFNIPGIGRLLYRSILLADWNIAFPLLLLLSAITIFSYWLADIIYTKIDPKSAPVEV